jgi:UDP-2,4-diacetamido-2,4,6-trideoxy-beta-L-altropyranose hydrolase
MSTTANRRIVFRADGDSQIGLGHIVRSLALAEMLKNDFQCIFLTTNSEERIQKLISGTCQPVLLPIRKSIKEEIKEVKARLQHTDILVLDGYQFDADYQWEIKSSVHKLVSVDDKAEVHFFADLIINHGSPSLRSQYKAEHYTELLLGLPYVLMRKPFLKAAKDHRVIERIKTVFICMGGADPFKVTVKALRASVCCSFINEIIIVTGSAFQDVEALKSEKEGQHGKSIIHEENVSAERMVELIRQSDLAICPASSIALEVCAVKSGLLTGTVIGNQSAIHSTLMDAGCGISLDDFNLQTVESIISFLTRLNDIKLVNNLVNNQQAAIDGRSEERLLEKFKALAA